MSREHPMGVYVEADAPTTPPAQPVQDLDRSWQTSSFDLLDGLQVSEMPSDGCADGGVDEPIQPDA